ncbi:MAG: glycosyltransferase [Novosphingobium sp.]
MRIVDVSAFYAPQGGGVKTYVERKLRAARPGREEVIIVAPGPTNATIVDEPGGKIITIASPRFPADRRYRYFADEPALHTLLDTLAPDVVEASSPWSSAAMVARWRGSAMKSLVMHADPLSAYAYRWFGGVASREQINRGFDWYWRHLLRLDRQFDMVVCASASLAARLSAGGLRKVVTNPMGVTPGIFSPRLRDPLLRGRLLSRCGLADDAVLLLGLGRHAPEKRWPMVIKAVTAAGFNNPVGMVLVGNGNDKGKVVRAATNNPHVHLCAPISDRAEIAAILASADALVHGCEAETFCLVAAEARASGLPIIVPDEGGASDQFVPGQGEQYAAGSPTSLVAAIGRFIASNPAEHRRAATIAAPEVACIDSHFDRLFEAYSAGRAPVLHAA